MSISHGMGIRFKRESNNGIRKSHSRMLLNDITDRCNGGLTMKTYLVLAIVVLTNFSQGKKLDPDYLS